MKLKKSIAVLSLFALSGCFSTFFVSDEEARQIGYEEGKTFQCLKYSNINELRNLNDLPEVGIVYQLKMFGYETVGATVFGAGRFNYIKRDYLFQKSVKNRKSIIAQARNQALNAKLSKAYCQIYLNTYENAYYQFKAQGY